MPLFDPDSRNAAHGLNPAREPSLGPVSLAGAMVAAVLLIVHLRGPHHHALALAGWSLGLLLLARHAARAQRVPARPTLLGAALVFIALGAAAEGQLVLSWLTSAAACMALVMPASPPRPASPEERRHVWALVDGTAGDTLAPFALRSDKAYVFCANRCAAQAYRVRLGTAVASGDPVGDPLFREAVIDAFCAQAVANGWRIAALGVSTEVAQLWRARGLSGLAIGRDVRLDLASFTMQGSHFRNLRQSVQHTHNVGVTTQIAQETGLDAELQRELKSFVARTGAGLQPRGFSMILDRPLRGEQPGVQIALARDRDGRLVALQRFASADGGRELSHDLTWRLPDAPNGVGDRLIVDMAAWGRAHGAAHLSLSFAAFPDLFAAGDQRSAMQRAAFRAVHLLDRFIKLESLYRFLRKFHAFDAQRHVMFHPANLPLVAAAMLSLEFGPAAKTPDRKA